MRLSLSFSILLFFFLGTSGLASEKVSESFALPSRAIVEISRKGSDGGSDGIPCGTLSIQDVRTFFSQYRLIKPSSKDLHNKYLWTPCFVEGTITLGKKKFKWKHRPGNTLETDYPDGKQKVLGGKPTDGPSAD